MLITIISAYQGKEKNVARAKEYMKFVAEQGHTPLAAHVMYHDVLDDKVPKDREKGMNTGCYFLRISDLALVFVHPDTGITEGMRADIMTAKAHKKLVDAWIVKETSDGKLMFRKPTPWDGVDI